MDKIRVSCHGMRHTAGARHNDRDQLDYTKEKNVHIQQELSSENFYWIRFKDKTLTFQEAEWLFYKNIYSDGIDAQNQRNIKAGHPKRNKTVQDIFHDKRTCPDEFIFQIGDADVQEKWDLPTKRKMKKIMIKAAFDTCKASSKGHYGFNIIDLAYHVDELGGAHVHVRGTYCASYRGHWVPRQRLALEQAGFMRPYPEESLSRYNNPKITFTNYLRDTFLEKVRELIATNNLDVEVQNIRHPEIPDKHLSTREYKKTITNFVEEVVQDKIL